jgi:hypothetical protein
MSSSLGSSWSGGNFVMRLFGFHRPSIPVLPQGSRGPEVASVESALIRCTDDTCLEFDTWLACWGASELGDSIETRSYIPCGMGLLKVSAYLIPIDRSTDRSVHIGGPVEIRRNPWNSRDSRNAMAQSRVGSGTSIPVLQVLVNSLWCR